MRAFSAERRCGNSVRRTNSARSASDSVISTAEDPECDMRECKSNGGSDDHGRDVK
jgi:hypothetical protein